jgi:hypothetical protein
VLGRCRGPTGEVGGQSAHRCGGQANLAILPRTFSRAWRLCYLVRAAAARRRPPWLVRSTKDASQVRLRTAMRRFRQPSCRPLAMRVATKSPRTYQSAIGTSLNLGEPRSLLAVLPVSSVEIIECRTCVRAGRLRVNTGCLPG